MSTRRRMETFGQLHRDFLSWTPISPSAAERERRARHASNRLGPKRWGSRQTHLVSECDPLPSRGRTCSSRRGAGRYTETHQCERPARGDSSVEAESDPTPTLYVGKWAAVRP